MAGKLSPASLARSSARRPWVVVGVWVALFVVGGILSKAFLSDALTTSADFTNHPESRQAQQLLEQRLTGPRHANEIVIIHSDGATVDDPGFQNDVEKLAAAVRATHVVERVSAFPQSPDPSVVSKDRHTELMPVVMSGSIDDATNNIDKVLAVTLHAQQPAGFRVLVAGDVMLDRYWSGPVSRISPEAPVPVVRIAETEERPGGAGNVALNVAALGATARRRALVCTRSLRTAVRRSSGSAPKQSSQRVRPESSSSRRSPGSGVRRHCSQLQPSGSAEPILVRNRSAVMSGICVHFFNPAGIPALPQFGDAEMSNFHANSWTAS